MKTVWKKSCFIVATMSTLIGWAGWSCRVPPAGQTKHWHHKCIIIIVDIRVRHKLYVSFLQCNTKTAVSAVRCWSCKWFNWQNKLEVPTLGPALPRLGSFGPHLAPALLPETSQFIKLLDYFFFRKSFSHLQWCLTMYCERCGGESHHYDSWWRDTFTGWNLSLWFKLKSKFSFAI